MIPVTVIHLLSVIISIIINRINYLGCLNSITARGKYAIKGTFDLLYNHYFGMSVIQYLIPFYNIIKSISRGVSVVNNMDNFYEMLNSQDLLELMEEDIIEEYETEPTMGKSLELCKQHEQDIASNSYIIFPNNSVIYFNHNEEGPNCIKRVIGGLAHEDHATQYAALKRGIEFYKATILVHSASRLTNEEIAEFLKIPYRFDISNIDENLSLEEYIKILQESIEYANKEENQNKTEPAVRVLRKKNKK